MNIKTNNEFNKYDYFKEYIKKILQSDTKAQNEIEGILSLLSKSPDTYDNIEKKKILNRLNSLLSKSDFLALIQMAKNEKGIPDLSETTRDNRTETLNKIAELADSLSDKLSEVIFSDFKRKYNMSELYSDNMIQTEKAADGTTRKAVKFKRNNFSESKSISDFSGITIAIQNVGTLNYKCGPSLEEDISAYRVSKYKGDQMTMEPKILFSNISMQNLDDPSYKSIVANTLLTDNNINLSRVNGYIGELCIIDNSPLKDGEEKIDSAFYTYKIPASKYSLIYDGEKIEAVKAYKEEIEKEKTNSQNKNSGR